jgi:DNA polymerase V
MRYIGVLDCNNFFVSCERLFRPDLRRRPVAVLSSNDGCIVARSQEIKDSGIPMGVPYFQVKDILKDIDAVCFSSHFALYRDISARVFSVVRDYCGELEQYSIDEAFFAYEADEDKAVVQYITALKERVERAVGIPVSIGVADTKTRAKLVNAYAKKHGGIAVYRGDDFLAQFGEKALSEVWGVGRQLGERYRAAKITTINELLATPRMVVAKLTHTPGCELQAELLGQAVYLVSDTETVPKSMMSTRSFSTKTNNLSLIQDALAHHVRHVFEELRAKELVTTGLRVLLLTSRQGDWRFYGGAKDVTLTVPTADTGIGLSTALSLLGTLYEPGVPYTKTGVVAYGLCPARFVTKDLFADAARATPEGLGTVVDTLNNRFGRDTIRQGVFVKTASWQAKSERRSPGYTTDWQALQTVSAKPHN